MYNSEELVLLWFDYQGYSFTKLEKVLKCFDEISELFDKNKIKNASFDKSLSDIKTMLMSEDFEKFENCINTKVKKPLTQSEFDSLVSFVFNIGEGNFAKSTMLKLLNQGHFELAAQQFDRWIYAKGKPLNGLKKRRLAEKTMFLSRE